MRRFVLKSMFPTIKEAQESICFEHCREFYIVVERGWLFFDNKKEWEEWIAIDVTD